MEKLVSLASKLLIQVIMTDSKVSEKILENSSDASKYKNCSILDNGTIVLGKTKSRFWNQLLNCQDKIQFDSLALKIWDALVDMSSGINNRAILEGLSVEILKKSVRKKEYDYVVRRLFDCWSHVAQKSAGYQNAETPAGANSRRLGLQEIASEYTPREIVININGLKRTIPFVDSIGDKFNFGLDIGITGVHRLD